MLLFSFTYSLFYLLVNYCVSRQVLTITCKGTASIAPLLERLTFSLDCHPTLIDEATDLHRARLSQPIENVYYHEEWIKAYLVTGKD